MSVMLRPQVWMQTLSMHHYSCEWIWEKKVLWLTPENKRMAGFQIQMRVTLKCDCNIWPSTTNFSERLTSFNGEPISSAHSRQVEKKNMANIRTAHNWNHKYFSPKKSSNTQKLSTHSQVSDTHTHTRRRHTESNVQFRFGLLAIYKYRWPGEMANQSFIKCVESWLSFHHIYIYRWYIVQVEQLSESRVVCVWQFLVFPKFKSK